ncbi:MAG: hypothetical protein ACLQVM_05695 [Terriglobia bacterium]
MMRRSDPSPVPRRAGEDAVAGDAFNEALLDSLNRSGDLYLTHTKLNDRYVIRFCVGQTYTEFRHVERAWERIREETARLESRPKT